MQGNQAEYPVNTGGYPLYPRYVVSPRNGDQKDPDNVKSDKQCRVLRSMILNTIGKFYAGSRKQRQIQRQYIAKIIESF